MSHTLSPTPPALPPPYALEGDERVDLLRPGLWVVQRARGHRATTDDQLLAWAALVEAERAGRRGAALRVLDLGAGKGVVTLWLSAALPRARFVGIEAFAQSHALSLKGRALNGLEGRFEPLLGDLRDPAAWAVARAAVKMIASSARGEGEGEGEGFDLICGAPPFMPLGAGVQPADPQRAAGRFELKGGVEGYLSACAALLAPEGRALILMDGNGERRALDAARGEGLRCLALTRVRPRPLAPPTYALLTLALPGAGEGEAPPLQPRDLPMRAAEGEAWSPSYEQARLLLGLPPSAQPSAQPS